MKIYGVWHDASNDGYSLFGMFVTKELAEKYIANDEWLLDKCKKYIGDLDFDLEMVREVVDIYEEDVIAT